MASISYRPDQGGTCASGVLIMTSAVPTLAWSGLRAAISFLR
jgi:hypothetical protein